MQEVYPQSIHETINSYRSSRNFHIIVVYVLFKLGEHYGKKLRDIKTNMRSAWLIMGDFNTKVDQDDRVSTSKIQKYETISFKSFMMIEIYKN